MRILFRMWIRWLLRRLRLRGLWWLRILRMAVRAWMPSPQAQGCQARTLTVLHKVCGTANDFRDVMSRATPRRLIFAEKLLTTSRVGCGSAPHSLLSALSVVNACRSNVAGTLCEPIGQHL